MVWTPQSSAKPCIKYLKEHVNVLLDRVGAPDAAWFHAAQYLAGLHSILSNSSLPDKMTPMQFRTGITPDISPWLQFTFWQPILFLDNEAAWPSSNERSGYWLGVADNIGDLLTYWIFDDQSWQVLARSVVRPYNNNEWVKWDPKFRYQSDQGTAQHGGISSLQRVLFLKNWAIPAIPMTILSKSLFWCNF